MGVKKNHLDLNVGNTKEVVIDFRKSSAVVPDLFINGVKVERVTEYKYLGTVLELDSKLNFNANNDFINKKCQSRLYCLRKLRSFHVNTDILCTFYRCFLESVLTFSFLVTRRWVECEMQQCSAQSCECGWKDIDSR